MSMVLVRLRDDSMLNDSRETVRAASDAERSFVVVGENVVDAENDVMFLVPDCSSDADFVDDRGFCETV